LDRLGRICLSMKPDLQRMGRAALLAIAMIAVAFLLRVWPLGGTGTRFAWLTFYPAVMAGAIQRVAESNPALGGVLQHLAGRFRYTAILQALQACGSSDLMEVWTP
jgi:hypothetical protein